jgi:hypothetical protein
MSDLAASFRRRGSELLFLHTFGPGSGCAGGLCPTALAASAPRPPADKRLRAALGFDLTERLVASLAGDQRGERRGRTSSSP